MKKEKSNNFVAKGMLFAVAVILLGIGASYAYFTVVMGGETSKTTLKAGNISFETDLTNANNRIRNENMSLVTSAAQAEKVEFYLHNTSTNVNGQYEIYLKDVKLSKNFYSKYLKWELLRDGTVVDSGSFETTTDASGTTFPVCIDNCDSADTKAVTSVDDILLTKTPLLINAQKQDKLIFRIYLLNDDKVVQNDETMGIDLTEGTLEGRLVITAVPVNNNSN